MKGLYPEGFCCWLLGFLDAHPPPCADTISTIREKLNQTMEGPPTEGVEIEDDEEDDEGEEWKTKKK